MNKTRPQAKPLGDGQVEAKRHQNPQKDVLEGVTRPAIRRLCRRAGIKRISGLMYLNVRTELQKFLEKTLFDAMIYMNYARRNTMTANDVVYALKRQGKQLYGF